MRYILHPGYVISKFDGDMHFICAYELARLYGVDYNKCIVVDESRAEYLGYRHQEGDIHLYPDFSGKYRIY